MYQVYVDAFSLPEAVSVRQMLLASREFQVADFDADAPDARQQRRELLNEADFVVVGPRSHNHEDPIDLVSSRRVRIVRAGGAAAEGGWVYGLPELSGSQRRQIAESARVASPGCCAAGAVLLLRPLLVSGLLAQDSAVSVFCVAGGSATGAWHGHESAVGARADSESGRAHALGFGHVLDHPYAEEIRSQALLNTAPNFVAVRGGFPQGVLLYIPLHVAAMNPALPRAVPRSLVEQALMKSYEGSEVVRVSPVDDDVMPGTPEAAAMALQPEEHNGTNRLRLHVFGSRDGKRLCLAAVYDNLGKGHCGAILQNLRIMAGLN